MALMLQTLSLLSSSTLISYIFIFAIITFFVHALFLMITTRIFKTENNDYKIAMKVLWLPILVSLVLATILILTGLTESSIFNGVVSILVLGVYVWVIKVNYCVSVVKAFFIFLVSGFFLGLFYSIIFALLWAYTVSRVMEGIAGIQSGAYGLHLPLLKNLILG